jgi:hypothetical protein
MLLLLEVVAVMEAMGVFLTSGSKYWLTWLFRKPTYSDTAIPEATGSHFDIPAASQLTGATRSHFNIPEASPNVASVS